MDYKYLNNNISHDIIASLSNSEREVLCAELRDKIINTVSVNGGHLASNLGSVELTVSLLSVFDGKKDRIVFDVGHQSYSYKLLTGRFDEFDTLRQRGGISGFPRISESCYDSFDTGHSSTSVSAALGMARARDLNEGDNYVVSIIGDGALTGGLAYEALNDAGHSDTKMIVILNDNEMSISKNVGGLSSYLKKLRMSRGYISAKKNTEQFLNKNLPILGKPIVSLILSIKKFFRFIVNRKQHPSFFEDMGLVYYGPIDGHDVKGLINALEAVKDIENTVLLHVVTKKGKGYEFAENNPSDYHGVSPFDIGSGVKKSASDSFTNAFKKTMHHLGKNPKVVAICAAMPQGTGLDSFANNYPDKFFDCGIAEEHAVTMAGGLAVSGFTPIVAIYSSFLQRAYDEIIHDVCFMNNHVIFAIDRAGFVGADGHTHHGLNDISYMNSMPNMTVFAPRDYQDLTNCLNYAVETLTGPCAIRYPRGTTEYGYESLYHEQDELIKPHLVNDIGNDFALISIGSIATEVDTAFDKLSSIGLKGKNINLTMVKPVPTDDLIDLLKGVKQIITVEEGIISGGAGENIKKAIYTHIDADIHNLGVDNQIVRAGSHGQQLKDVNLDSDSIVSFIKNLY